MKHLNFLAYCRLMRLDKPIGFYLLWAPTAWALWLACATPPPIMTVLLFFIGTLIMRSAGCVINDITDRNIDGLVERTKLRPLVTQEISFKQATGLLILLLSLALVILLLLPKDCLQFALYALILSMLYPLAKRFISCPQLILSLSFSMGMPMAFAARNASIWSLTLSLLMLINILWVLAYDTEYAMVDKPDDLIAGVKSSAILFGRYDKFITIILLSFMHFLWLFIASMIQANKMFYGFWLAAIGCIIYQYHILYTCKSDTYLAAFKSNGVYGLWMWIALIFA